MEDREDALDFIYKGWREGRQQRRNVVRQRGLDRTRSMLGPIMAQRARGSMASMPPSMPVEETRVPTEASPVENVGETVSMPPVPENDMTDDIMNPTDHPNDFKNEMVQPTPRENTPVLPSPVSKPVQPYAGQEEEERRIEEAKAEAAEAREKHEEKLRAKEAEQPMTEEDWANVGPNPVQTLVAHNPKTGDILQISSDPLPTKEEFERDYPGYVIGKHPEHTKAFEEAYSEMEEEAKNTNQPAPSKEDQADEMFRRVQNRKAESEGQDPVFEEDDSRLDEKSKKAMAMFETVQAAKRAREENKEPTQKETKTPKPDKKVSQAAKETIKPAEKKATKKGKSNVREAAKRLASAGQEGKKPDETPPAKKKVKDKRKGQDLTGIKKPDDSDLRRSADQQMLADVLLKKIPVADLRMFDRMLGGGIESPVLVDDMGFITQTQAANPAHVLLAAISDNPNPFDETVMDPRLTFDMSRLKIAPTPARFPNVPAMNASRNKLLEEMTSVPTKTVRRLDDKGKIIPTGEKDRLGNPTYEMESVEDEDIGFFIQDGKNKRRMTPEEAAEILDSRKKAKSQPQVKIDLASPYWSENQWNIPITRAGKTSTLPDVFGMMRTSVGADPRELGFVPDPRTSGLADWSNLKEIISVSPADFKRKIKGSKDNLVRIGDAVYQHNYLKDIVDSMKPSDMANEDLVLTGMKNAPLFIAGRGVKRYDEEPSYFETALAPFIEAARSNNYGDELDLEDSSYESMNDLFE